MSCNCNKPKCDGKCGISPSVLQINNPGDCTLFHRVEVPASMGDSITNPPKNGDYRNVLLYYVADGTSWLFSSDGIPQKLVSGFTDYEDAINLPSINGVTLLRNKTGEELGLQDKLTAGDGIEISSNNTISVSNIEQYAHFFDTVADMKAAENLTNGSFAKTLGYYVKNDKGGATYKIRALTNEDVIDEATIIAIGDSGGLVAELILSKEMNTKQFGIIPSSLEDNHDLIQIAINNCDILNFESNASYLINSVLTVHHNTHLKLNGANLISTYKHIIHNFKQTDQFLGYGGNGNIAIEDGTITGGCISLIHGKNITIKNILFNNCINDHCIEICACKNVKVSRCDFNGCPNPASSFTLHSAINIDPAYHTNFPWLPENNPTYDHTANTDIYIEDNHSDMAANTDENITDLRFVDAHSTTSGDTPIEYNNKNIVVINNIVKLGRGTANYLFKCDYVTFANNYVETPRFGVGIAGDYVDIHDNTFIGSGTNQGTPVWIYANSENISVYDNTIKMYSSNGDVKKLYTFDLSVTSYSFIKSDWLTLISSTTAPDAEVALTSDYTKFNTISVGLGAGGYLQQFSGKCFYSRDYIQSGDAFVFLVDGGKATITFGADNKITYANDSTDGTASHKNLRWLMLGKNNI